MTDYTLTNNEGQISLKGDLTFSTIIGVREKLEKAIRAGNKEFVIDFANVSRVDSSSISLCLCCLRLAKRIDKTLHFKNLPADINAIAHLVGLESLSEL